MKILKISLLVLLLLIGDAVCGKLKLVAFKGPHAGFVGLKVRTPKLLGFKKHGLGFGHGLGGFGGHGHKGFGGGGFHSSGYEHHEYHHSGGSFGGGGWFGK
ncbi:hypothetical protein FF38_04394 [Lucilia cuprina]|uniref:Uncharacterized protein n=1 Tax=Lucilia cuprina TaxID=7375 RepID=A0A0L0C7B4_LUCCU|nr:glycine-rich cell wall structural protein [Lucilia cuprina]KAI8129382.1 hypothetical protein CVS40_1532 [Lucilia cuprina]KNC28142.1 hypothetical protein FF38_04394 [Lucilia cuprina]